MDNKPVKPLKKGISWKFMDNVFYFIPILWTMHFILWTIKNMDNVFYFVPILWTIKKHGQCLLFCTNFMDNKKTWTMSSFLNQFYGQSKNMDNVFFFVPILWTIKKHGQCLLFYTNFMDNQKTWTMSSFLYQFYGQ
jgi:type 1 glutamine amidotransferase